MEIPLSSNRTNTADMVYTYLREIGRVPLLTREQEIVYGKQVQVVMHLMEAKEALTKKLGRFPTEGEWAAHVQLTSSELNKTLRQGELAKQRMVAANLRLVVAIAKQYQKRGIELLDLIQEGSIGLQRGVEKFDPTRGYKFSTYAYWWIRQAITRAIAQQSRTIRLPSHITEKLNKIKKVQRQLSQKLGRAPTTTEVALELELTPELVKQCLRWALYPVSLNSLVGGEQDTELLELLEDTGTSPEEFVLRTQSVVEVAPLMACLTPQQQEVLALRFGLEDEREELTLAQIGKRLHLSRERVRQIEGKALNQLRERALMPQTAGLNQQLRLLDLTNTSAIEIS